jgi:hypothetical protein
LYDERGRIFNQIQSYENQDMDTGNLWDQYNTLDERYPSADTSRSFSTRGMNPEEAAQAQQDDQVAVLRDNYETMAPRPIYPEDGSKQDQAQYFNDKEAWEQGLAEFVGSALGVSAGEAAQLLGQGENAPGASSGPAEGADLPTTDSQGRPWAEYWDEYRALGEDWDAKKAYMQANPEFAAYYIAKYGDEAAWWADENQTGGRGFWQNVGGYGGGSGGGTFVNARPWLDEYRRMQGYRAPVDDSWRWLQAGESLAPSPQVDDWRPRRVYGATR